MIMRTDEAMKREGKKIVKVLQYTVVIIFGMAAGAGCFHQQMQAKERQQERAEYRTVHIVQEQEQPEKEIVRKVDKDTGLVEIKIEAYYDDLGLLAACVEAEAGNQSLTGKRMVAAVVLNRVDDPEWPDTITGVITQENQFATYASGAIDAADPSEESFEAVRMELENRICRDIYYFTAGGYGIYGTPMIQVEDHYFSGR